MSKSSGNDRSILNPGGYEKSRGLRQLTTGWIKPYRGWLMGILLSMLMESLVSLAAPWPLKIVIDNVINEHPLPQGLHWLRSLLPGDQFMNLAIVCGILLVLLTAIGGLASFIDNYLTEYVAQNLAKDLRREIYHHLQSLSLAYYDTHQVGKLLSTLTTDVDTIQEFISSTILNLLVDLLTILCMLGLMVYLKWDFALICAGMAPLLLLFMLRFKKEVKKATRELRMDQAEMISVMQTGLESIRTVNVFGRQELEEDRLKRVNDDTVNAALKARKIKSIVSPVFALGVSLCLAFVLWRGSILIRAGLMTLGTLTVYLSYLNKFFSPVKDLAKMTVGIAQATVAIERVQQILTADSTIADNPGAQDPGTMKGEIVFEHVFFSYIPDIPVLSDINLCIAPRQHIGICGPTGGGKSTLASLIPRLYNLSSGQIRIDGINISDLKLAELRKGIAFVLQDTMLFFGSVSENIAYGRPNATEEEIVQAAKQANADEFIRKLPKGYGSLIGERGITLSGGERQRIGLARVFLRNSPIVILDEPTASLDSGSEKLLTEAMERLMKDRTVITISHKINTLIHCDKIILLKDGMVAGEGTHQRLMAENPFYAALNQN